MLCGFEDEIEREIGMSLNWREVSKGCRIYVEKSSDLKQNDAWEIYFDWFCDMSMKFKAVVKKYDK